MGQNDRLFCAGKDGNLLPVVAFVTENNLHLFTQVGRSAIITITGQSEVKGVVHYQLLVTEGGRQRPTTVDRRYSEFLQLNRVLDGGLPIGSSISKEVPAAFP